MKNGAKYLLKIKFRTSNHVSMIKTLGCNHSRSSNKSPTTTRMIGPNVCKYFPKRVMIGDHDILEGLIYFDGHFNLEGCPQEQTQNEFPDRADVFRIRFEP